MLFDFRLMMGYNVRAQGPLKDWTMAKSKRVAFYLEEEWLKAAMSNPAFDFLKDPREDIYLPTDGRPASEKG